MNQIDLHKRCAVVTGGAQGIGLAIAERFIASGASVCLWDRDESAQENCRCSCIKAYSETCGNGCY